MTTQEKNPVFRVLILLIQTEFRWRNKWEPVDGYENAKGLREEKNRKMLFSIFGIRSYLHLLFPNGESKQFEV